MREIDYKKNVTRFPGHQTHGKKNGESKEQKCFTILLKIGVGIGVGEILPTLTPLVHKLTSIPTPHPWFGILD